MIELYLRQDLSTEEIGKIYDVTRGTVTKWFEKLKIPTKRMIKAIKPSKEYMYKMYIEERLSFRQIMKRIRTKSNRKVKRLLDEYNIPIRGRSEAIKTQWENNPRRRRKQGEIFAECNSGTPSPKLLSEQEIKSRTKENNFIYINHYQKDNTTFIKYQCPKCGHIGDRRLGNLYRNGCPGCNIYKGEEEIKIFLENNKIKYKWQYAFDDCKFKSQLKFDFALFNKNNEVKYLIEYDGIFHYEVIPELRTEKDFEEQKLRDKIKNNYCKENNINLIRIPYWEFDNINKILSNRLDFENVKSVEQLSLFEVV